MFCPLQQHLNPMQTAAGVWPDTCCIVNRIRVLLHWTKHI